MSFLQFLTQKYSIPSGQGKTEEIIKAIEDQDNDYDSRRITADFKEFLSTAKSISDNQRQKISKIAEKIDTKRGSFPGKWYITGAKIADEYESVFVQVCSVEDIDESQNCHVKNVGIKIVDKDFHFVPKSTGQISGGETVQWGHGMNWDVSFELDTPAPCNGFLLQKLKIKQRNQESGETTKEVALWEWMGDIKFGETRAIGTFDTYYQQFATKICPIGVTAYGYVYFISGERPSYFQPDNSISRFVRRPGKMPSPACKEIHFLSTMSPSKAARHHANVFWNAEGSITWCQTKAGQMADSWVHRLPQPLGPLTDDDCQQRSRLFA